MSEADLADGAAHGSGGHGRGGCGGEALGAAEREARLHLQELHRGQWVGLVQKTRGSAIPARARASEQYVRAITLAHVQTDERELSPHERN